MPMWHSVWLSAMKYNIVLFVLKSDGVMAHQYQGLELEDSSP